MRDTPDYANWIPKKYLMLLGAGTALLALLFALSMLFDGGGSLLAARVILAALAFAALVFFIYIAVARRKLAYDGGGVQGKVLDNVLANLDWDGKGTLLDIGCGSGALAIKAARKFPEASVVGIDAWQGVWDYAKTQCEENAGIEGVADRIVFRNGDAARLDFPDAFFDAVVSNFVFHEVRSQPDKTALIREAFRVLKPGGVFSLEDIFFAKRVYGDFDAVFRDLSREVSEITLVDTRNGDFVPAFLRTPPMLGNMALIRGRK